MERRIRLDWSPKHLRPWCPGATLPAAESTSGPSSRTGFLRVQTLMERLRGRIHGYGPGGPVAGPGPVASPESVASPEPAAPLPARTAHDRLAEERVPEAGQRDVAR